MRDFWQASSCILPCGLTVSPPSELIPSVPLDDSRRPAPTAGTVMPSISRGLLPVASSPSGRGSSLPFNMHIPRRLLRRAAFPRQSLSLIGGSRAFSQSPRSDRAGAYNQGAHDESRDEHPFNHPCPPWPGRRACHTLSLASNLIGLLVAGCAYSPDVAHFHEGVALAKRVHASEAAWAYLPALAANPGLIEARLNLGVLLYQEIQHFYRYTTNNAMK